MFCLCVSTRQFEQNLLLPPHLQDRPEPTPDPDLREHDPSYSILDGVWLVTTVLMQQGILLPSPLAIYNGARVSASVQLLVDFSFNENF